MTLSTKHSVNLALNAIIAVLSSWLVAEVYGQYTGLWLPAVLLSVAVFTQVWITVKVKSRDEQILDAFQEQQLQEMRARMEVSAAAAQQMTEEIKRGNLKEAKRWQNFRDKL